MIDEESEHNQYDTHLLDFVVPQCCLLFGEFHDANSTLTSACMACGLVIRNFVLAQGSRDPNLARQEPKIIDACLHR